MYIYIYIPFTSSIYIKKRHLFLSESYFYSFQTFEDSSKTLRRFGRNRNITRLEINVLFLYILIEEGNYKKLNGKFNNADKFNYALVILLLSTLPALLNLRIMGFKQRKN